MDNFLQLVPIENDSDSDQGALVYGDDDAVAADATPVALEEQLESHATPLFAADEGSENGAVDLHEYSNEREHYGDEAEPGEEEEDDADPDELERRRYWKRAKLLETHMQQAELEVQQRLDAMKRILELKDPMEQLSEYMALKLDERRDEDEIDIIPELLKCAQRLSNEEDSEIALLGAFFFTCDSPPSRTNNRGMAAMLPVVAAMMEASSALDRPFC